MDPLLAAAVAENLAAWHELQLGALGVASMRAGGWWLAPGPVPPIYLRAVAVVPDADPAVLAGALTPEGWAAVADPFARADLAPHGWQAEAARPWSVRPPGPVAGPALPPGHTTARVTDPEGLAALEAAAAAGFAVDPPAPGTWHAPGGLADTRAAAWTVTAGGGPVATAMAMRAGGVLGIYGVATLPGWRRRGIGGALVAHLLAQAPDLPAVLQPSPMAAALYARLGFQGAGAAASWLRPPRG